MKKLFFFVGLLCVLIGCSQQQNDPRVDQLQNTVSQLQTTVSQLSDKVTQLSAVSSNENSFLIFLQNRESNNVVSLSTSLQYMWNAQQRQQSNIETLDDNIFSFRPVLIDPQSTEYFFLRTPFGILLVATDSVEPYLDGYRIHLSVGNLTSATFHGFSLICSTYESTNMVQTFHSITNDLPDTLNPGSWNKIEFVMAPATMEEVRNASVSIDLNHVALIPALHGSAE